jgi:hypothetical protein
MSKAFGVVLILAGIGVASSLFAIDSGAEQDAPRPVPDQSRPADNVLAAVGQAKQPSQGASSAPVSRHPPVVQAAARPPAGKPPAPAAVSVPVVVTLSQRVEPAPAALHDQVARMPTDRASLARDLQRELKRVGCYSGPITGAWTAASSGAMKAFTERVNATLPVEKPDDILLVLVRAHQGEVCGKPCPAGQGLAEDGRCLPNAILAQAVKRKVPPPAAAGHGGHPHRPAITGWSTITAAAMPAPPSAPPLAGRMALAGPKGEGPEAAVQAPPSGPVSAAHAPGKRAAAGRRTRHVTVRERRHRRYVQPTYARRSNFVESVLRNPHSFF